MSVSEVASVSHLGNRPGRVYLGRQHEAAAAAATLLERPMLVR